MKKNLTLTINKNDFIDYLTDKIIEENDFSNYVYAILDCGMKAISELNTLEEVFEYTGGILPTYVIDTQQSVYNKNYDSTNEETLIDEIDEEYCYDIINIDPDDIKIIWNNMV